MSKPIVIALGEILWDMLPTGKRAGGAPVNFAYHASQNGAESYAISAVGNDELGAELLNVPFIFQRRNSIINSKQAHLPLFSKRKCTIFHPRCPQ